MQLRSAFLAELRAPENLHLGRVRAKIGPRNGTIGKFQVSHGVERDRNVQSGGFSASKVEFDAKICVFIFYAS